eukprot:10880352-Karenia_brevis.AAC.1
MGFKDMVFTLFLGMNLQGRRRRRTTDMLILVVHLGRYEGRDNPIDHVPDHDKVAAHKGIVRG